MIHILPDYVLNIRTDLYIELMRENFDVENSFMIDNSSA